MMLNYILFTNYFLLLLTNLISGQLPDQLDPFLEKLFDHDECEEFISSADYSNIATSSCDPFICDFPRQICARPSATFQDKSTNLCRTIPSECLTAANDGVPLGPPKPLQPVPTQPNRGGGTSDGRRNVVSPSSSLVTMPPNVLDICQMEAPTGRFCGFRPMFTYNKETLQCDEFWFPGCRTSETNTNLFNDYQECQKVAEMCKPTPPPTIAPYRPPATVRPRRIMTTPPPAPSPAPSPIVDAFKSLGGGGNPNGNGALGAIGMFTGSGLGETGQGPLGNFVPNPTAGGQGTGAGASTGNEPDLGLFGLIQQGIMGAQAAQQGNGGKEAASKAAGKILQQFTGFDLGGLGNNFGGLFG